MQVLVLGATGMLGHKMFQVLRGRFADTWCTIRNPAADGALRRVGLFQGEGVIGGVRADDFASLRTLLSDLKPQVVVNCIGIIKQRSQAKTAIPSITLNALLPHKLAETCQEWGGRLIHFSTDCVFSGRRGGYTEDDLADAEDLYGRTKYLGEVAADNAVTLRTSIIGRELTHHQSLLEWFLRQDHATVRGFTLARYSGTTTNRLAEVVGDIIEYHPALSGLYQVTGQTISKHDLLCLIRDAYKMDVEIIPDETVLCDRSMKGDRFRRATGHASPPWTELIAQLANDPTPYENWRFQ
jgi:dTDP-4-dehydrorhamnose reductase